MAESQLEYFIEIKAKLDPKEAIDGVPGAVAQIQATADQHPVMVRLQLHGEDVQQVKAAIQNLGGSPSSIAAAPAGATSSDLREQLVALERIDQLQNEIGRHGSGGFYGGGSPTGEGGGGEEPGLTEAEARREREANIRLTGKEESSFMRGIRLARASEGRENPDVDWYMDAKIRERNREWVALQEGRRGPSDSPWIAAGAAHGATPQELQRARTLEAAEALKTFRKRLNDLEHPMTATEQAFNALSMGQWRRGGGQFVSSITEPYFGTEMSSILGGFAGSIASAIALPIGWAVGDAMMNLPQLVQDRLTDTRGQRSLAARAGTGTSKEWAEQQRLLAGFGAPYLDPQGNPIGPQTNRWMLAYQAEAGELRTPADIRAGGRMGAAMVSLVASQREADPEEAMRALARLRTGDVRMQSEAMQELFARPYLRQLMVEEMMDARKLPRGTIGEQIAVTSIQRMMEFKPGGKLGYDPEHIAFLIERAAMENRSFGELSKQVNETRIGPWRGYLTSVVGPGPGEPTVREWGYATAYYQAEMDERRFGAKGTLISGSPEEQRRRADRMARGEGVNQEDVLNALSKVIGPGAIPILRDKLFDVNPQNPVLTEEQMKKWRGVAETWAGRPGAAPFWGGEDVKPNFWGPSDYRFTSFTGLAEQMQQMWSGVPADAMQASATSLANIDTKMDQLIAVVANGSVINMGPMPANWNDVTVPNAVGGIA